MVQEFRKLVVRTAAMHPSLPNQMPHSLKNIGTPKILVEAKINNVPA
jgi:hypothetical protein